MISSSFQESEDGEIFILPSQKDLSEQYFSSLVLLSISSLHIRNHFLMGLEINY